MTITIGYPSLLATLLFAIFSSGQVVRRSNRAFFPSEQSESAFDIPQKNDPKLNAYFEKLNRQKGKHVANAIIAAKFARAVYFMLNRKTGFSREMLLKGKR